MQFPRHAQALAITLSLVVFAPAALAQNATLALIGAPTGGTVRVHPGFTPDPSNTTVTGGGTIEHPTCGGYLSARPQIMIAVTANVPWVRVYATASVDTSIAILAPGGQWRCADDTYGSNPSIDGSFRRGNYRVWVGTATPGATVSAVVTVTAHRRQRPVEAPVQPGEPLGADAAQNPIGAAAAMAQQALGGSQTSPLLVPLATLARAGLGPNGLPPSLDSVLRQPDAGVANLDPTQIMQLGDLARAGLTAAQLASVTNALGGASPMGGGAPQISPAQLGQLSEMARNGLSSSAIQSTLSSMLRGVATQ